MTEITDYITMDLKAIDSQDTIESVLDFFDDLIFSHFPVVENGTYIGNIAFEDIETFDIDKKVIDYKYTLEHFFATTDMIWMDVLEIFAKNNTNLVPVLDEKNNYIGYYEIEDVIKILHETPFFNESGGIIIIKTATLDYSMSQITQIVETNNAKLLGLFVSDKNIESVQITIKISTGPMNEIIQTFRRYNYEIISEHKEDNYINTLKERSDYLNKFLNM